MFSEMKKEVNTFLLNYFENKGSFNKVIYDSASYSLNIGGKRIRPLLMLLTYNIYKENWREILEFSSAIPTYVDSIFKVFTSFKVNIFFS